MSKKFITVIPLQPPQKLNKNIYEAVDNEELAYDKETSFPVIPLIAGYTKKGESIEVIAIRHDYENSIENYKKFEQELKALSEEQEFSYYLKKIEIPYDNSMIEHMKTFSILASLINDGDEINACLTYGTKPLSIVELMTLNYAYRIKKDCSYGALVYGELDHNSGKGKLYDITSLFIVDDMIHNASKYGIVDPIEYIKARIEEDEG